MQEGIKFLLSALKDYFAADFAAGKPFAPKWEGWKLTRNGQTENELLDAFARYMDSTTYDLCIPYDRMVAIFDELSHPDERTSHEERLNKLHLTLNWHAYHVRQGITAEMFAESQRVTSRTVRNWLKAALDHVKQELVAPQFEEVPYPKSYVPWDWNEANRLSA